MAISRALCVLPMDGGFVQEIDHYKTHLYKRRRKHRRAVHVVVAVELAAVVVAVVAVARHTSSAWYDLS